MPNDLSPINALPVASSHPTSEVLNALLADPTLVSREMQVDASTLLYEVNTPARWLYLVRLGQVRIIQPGKASEARLVEILGQGDWFGVPALAKRDTYGSIAMAVGAATVCQVPAEQLISRLPANPGAAEDLIWQLAGKLQTAHEDAVNLVFDDTSERLVKTLLQFSRSAAATLDDEEGGIVLQITHQQLAQAIGAARETVSLTLTQLRQQNLLRTGRNRLWFNPAALEEFSRRDQPTAAPK